MSDRRSFLKASGAGALALATGFALPGIARASALPTGSVAPALTSVPPDPSHWDTVPLYGHLGKPTDFTADEITFLTDHYKIITLEKYQGSAVAGNAEAASAKAFHQIKNKKASTNVLYYWNSAIDWTGLYSSLKNLPAAYTVKLPNGTQYIPRAGTFFYDTTNPDMRNWWVNEVASQVSKVGYDGVFIDGITWILPKGKKLTAGVGVAKQNQLIAGLDTMMTALRNKLGAEKTIIYNGLNYEPANMADGGKRYLDRTDGAMLEFFGIGNEANVASMTGAMNLVTDVAQQGKIVAFNGNPNSGAPTPVPTLANGVDFTLACFLCSAGNHSYFRYAKYRDWTADSGQLMNFPTLEHPLGAPSGPATHNGTTYTRTFQHAKVTVDLKTVKATINWS
jgi:hypothetical protein